jgi:hypothetical protein
MMHDVHSSVANSAAVTTMLGWIGAHVAGVEAGIQLLLGLVTIAAMGWSIAASRAKKRHYDRLNDGRDSGV